MTIYFFSPIWNNQQFFDDNGNVLANGTITTYVGGSFSVEQATYSTQTGTTNSNPIVLDPNGRITAEMWLIVGAAYNMVLRDVNGNTIDSAVNIIGQEPSSVASVSATVNLWNAAGTPSYVGADSFLLAGNQTVQFAVGNRVQFINGVATYGYGTVTAVSYSSPNTTVTLALDSISVGSNVSAVFWSALIAAGITVDADAVSYVQTGLTYSNLETVGGQIANINNEITVLQTPTGVTPGTYLQANITVNAAGDLTFAQTGMPLTTKGDIEVFTNGPTRLPIGADGDVLTADSTQPAGLAWEPPFNAALTNGATTNLVRTGPSGFIADPDLTVTLAAGVVYNITVEWHAASPSAGVYISMAYTGTHQANAAWSFSQVNTGGYGSSGPFNMGQDSLLSGFNNIMLTATCTIYTTSAGNLSFNWGNASAGGNSMTRYAGSGIDAVQVG